MNEGRLSRPLVVGEASIEEIGLLMGGVHGQTEAPQEKPAMRLRLEPRKAPSLLALYGAPVAAIALTMLAGTALFTLMGFRGGTAVFQIFVEPLLEPERWPDIAVKASPLVMIATGLAIGFRANVWNIGAEGQYIVGAIAGTGVALATYGVESWWVLPLMLIAAIIGGAIWAAIPAILRIRLKVSEILTSLMLTYVAVQLLYYLVRRALA